MKINSIVLLVIGPEYNWRGEERSPVKERMKWYEVFMTQLRKYCPILPVLVVNNFHTQPIPEFNHVTFIKGGKDTEHAPSLDIGIRHLLNSMKEYNTVIFMDADCIIFGDQWYVYGMNTIKKNKCVGFHIHKLWNTEIFTEHTPTLMFWDLEYIKDKPMQAYEHLIGPEYDEIHQDLIIFRAILDNELTTDEGKQIQLNHYKSHYDTAQRSIVLAKKDKVFHHVLNAKAHDFIHLTQARIYAPGHTQMINRARLGWLSTTLHVPPESYGKEYLALLKQLYDKKT